MTQLPPIWQRAIQTEDLLPMVVDLAERYQDGERVDNGDSTHESFELTMVRRGRAFFSFANARATLDTGDVIIIRPQVRHNLRIQGNTACDLWVVRFSFDERAPQRVAFTDFLQCATPPKDDFLRIQCPPWSEVNRLLARIMQENRKAHATSPFMLRLLLLELFVLLSRSLATGVSAGARDSRNSVYMEQAREFIDQNHGSPMRLDDVAAFVYLSPSYLVREYKKAWGISPMQYLQQVRLKHAMELLRTTKLSVHEVAMQAGFSDQRRMNELFIRSAGMPPLTYRNRAQE